MNSRYISTGLLFFLLQHLLQHIPNVLWVIAGREKLKWEELDSRWGENLEQHLLDKLSSTNSMNFLKDSGITDEQLRKDLYVLTKGVPVYLDLCVDTYEAIKKEGKNPTITINDFGKNTKSLLGRFLKYITHATLIYHFHLFFILNMGDSTLLTQPAH